MAKAKWRIPGGSKHSTLTLAKKAAVRSSSVSAVMGDKGSFVIKKIDPSRGIGPSSTLDERECKLTKTKSGKTKVVCYVPGKGFKGLGSTRRARPKTHSKKGKAVSRAKAGSTCATATYASDRKKVTRCFSTDKAAERWLNQGVKRGLFSSGSTRTKGKR